MWEFITLGIMALLAFAFWREGLFSALLTLINVLLAGLLAFNFWEPIARALGSLSAGMDRFADALVLALLFVVILAALWLITALLGVRRLGVPRLANQIGGAMIGLLVGYVTAGILLCIFQTLPFGEKFLGYDPRERMGLGAPDRVWLALMHRASGVVFDRGESAWFDADGSFIPRYARYRRITEGPGGERRNRGEFSPVLETLKPAEAKDAGN